MSEPIENTTNTTPTPEPETPAEKTFTQSEVDKMIGKRLAAAMKGMPKDEELTAFRAWKESQQTEKERWDALTRERDESKAALTAAQAELEQYRRERFLVSKGVPAADADYYAFKIGKLVTDDTDFEKAAETYLKEHAPKEPEKESAGVSVRMGASLSGRGTGESLGDYINNRLRGR